MKKLVLAAAAGILTLGLFAQAPANPVQPQKSASQTQTQTTQGNEKPAAHKKHHKQAKQGESTTAKPAPTK